MNQFSRVGREHGTFPFFQRHFLKKSSDAQSDIEDLLSKETSPAFAPFLRSVTNKRLRAKISSGLGSQEGLFSVAKMI